MARERLTGTAGEEAVWPSPWYKVQTRDRELAKKKRSYIAATVDLRALVTSVDAWWDTYRNDRTGPRQSHSTSDRAWQGSASWKDYADLVANGDPETAATLAELEKRASAACPILRGTTPKPIRAVAGGAVSVGRHLAGSPVCMRKRRKVRQARGKSVRVGVNVSASAGVSTEIMQRHALACMAIVRAIESRGVEVELYGVTTSALSGCTSVIQIAIKRAGQYLDRNRFAALGHPSFLRRLVFAVKERHPDSQEVVTSSYGSPRSSHGAAWERELGLDLLIPACQFWGPQSPEIRDGDDPDYQKMGAQQWGGKIEKVYEMLPAAVASILPRVGL